MIAKVNGEWKEVKELRLKNGATVSSVKVEDVSLMDIAPDFITGDVDKGTQIQRALNEYKVARFNYKSHGGCENVPPRFWYLVNVAECVIKLLGGRI